MKSATFKQSRHLLELVEDKDPSCSQLQELFDSGLLSILLEATKVGKIPEVNRGDFRRVVGFEPFTPKTFKAIKLGTGLKTANEFSTALKKGGYRLSGWASDILGKPEFTVADKETEVELVVVSVADLGFPNGAKRADIYRKAQKLGLELCPSEVGPQLRLQYGDQPKGECLFVAMKPITDSGGDLDVFYVEHDENGLWIYCFGRPDGFCHGLSRWVFVHRK